MKIKWKQKVDKTWELEVTSKHMEGFFVYGESKEKCLIAALHGFEAEVGELRKLWEAAEIKLDKVYKVIN